MFFPERIRSIGPRDRVLEVGPGSLPHRRSDVFLERRMADEAAAFAQRGYQPNAADESRMVYYDGGRFPFQDGEFDYVICSHVIEHVPAGELSGFIAELQRVAPRGYLEFPNVFYELINYQDVHLWLMNFRDGAMLFLDKSAFRSSFIHKAYREMFYGPDDYLYATFHRFREFYFHGYEWERRIDWRIVSGFDELVNEDDYNRVRAYFAGRRPRQAQAV
ncbi:MAG: class I SAM-dependent methyltransferase [Phycisphaerae bacterium]|jgi:hypothetical protein